METIVACETLVRSVARAFYDDACVVIVDALVTDKYLREDEMRRRCKMSEKQARSILQFLESERMVSTETLAISVPADPSADDAGTGTTKKARRKATTTTQVVHWFIDYRRFVAVVRFRLHAMRQRVAVKETASREGSVAYECPHCGTRYSELDAFNASFVCQQRLCAGENRQLKELKEDYAGGADAQASKARSMSRKIEDQLGPDPRVGRRGLFDLARDLDGKPLPANRPSENRSAGMGGWLRHETDAQDAALFAGSAECGTTVVSRLGVGAGDTTADNGEAQQSNGNLSRPSSSFFRTNAQGQQVVVEFLRADDSSDFSDDDAYDADDGPRPSARSDDAAARTPRAARVPNRPQLREMPSHLRDDNGVAASLHPGLLADVRGALFDDSGPDDAGAAAMRHDDDDDDDDDVAWEDADLGDAA